MLKCSNVHLQKIMELMIQMKKNKDKLTSFILKSFLRLFMKTVLNDILGGRGSNSAFMNTTDVHNRFFSLDSWSFRCQRTFPWRFRHFWEIWYGAIGNIHWPKFQFATAWNGTMGSKICHFLRNKLSNLNVSCTFTGLSLWCRIISKVFTSDNNQVLFF